jgi:hypothetical protein
MRDDLDIPSVPQDAHSAKSDGANPREVIRHCVVCGASAAASLVVAPACQAHAAPDALSRALAEAREQAAILREGLDYYAAEAHYRLDGFAIRDRGVTARAALDAAAALAGGDSQASAKVLPTTESLTGSDPNFTGGLSTDEHMRRIRGPGYPLDEDAP